MSFLFSFFLFVFFFLGGWEYLFSCAASNFLIVTFSFSCGMDNYTLFLDFLDLYNLRCFAHRIIRIVRFAISLLIAKCLMNQKG